jgi:protein-S-isoprenylcysteine O-methyltransferase Ste14
LDFVFCVLADQSHSHKNHPAPRAGCFTHPARLYLSDRDHPPLDPAHPAALALPRVLAVWPLVLLAGAAVTIAGLLFAVWARVYLGRNWSRSVTIKEDHELITTGPYALARHPIYTGILTGLLGTAIALSQVRGFIAFALFFFAFWIKLRMEEQWMRSQFGETYVTYAHQTAALVPFLL